MKYNWTLEVKPNASGTQVVTVTKMNPVDDKPVSIWNYPTESINEAIEDMKNTMKHNIDINQKINVELTLNEVAELFVCYQWTPPQISQEYLDLHNVTRKNGFISSSNDSLSERLMAIIQNAVNS